MTRDKERVARFEREAKLLAGRPSHGLLDICQGRAIQ